MEPVVRLGLVIVVGVIAGSVAAALTTWGLWLLLWSPYGGAWR
jgi:hypothetical protein